MKTLTAWALLSLLALLAAGVLLRRDHEADLDDDDGFDALIAPLLGTYDRIAETLEERAS